MAILGDSDDDENKPLQNRRRGGGGRSKQSRTSISNPEPVAAFPQPPKERPDARHHLKVFIYFKKIVKKFVKISSKNSGAGRGLSAASQRKAGCQTSSQGIYLF